MSFFLTSQTIPRQSGFPLVLPLIASVVSHKVWIKQLSTLTIRASWGLGICSGSLDARLERAGLACSHGLGTVTAGRCKGFWQRTGHSCCNSSCCCGSISTSTSRTCKENSPEPIKWSTACTLQHIEYYVVCACGQQGRNHHIQTNDGVHERWLQSCYDKMRQVGLWWIWRIGWRVDTGGLWQLHISKKECLIDVQICIHTFGASYTWLGVAKVGWTLLPPLSRVPNVKMGTLFSIGLAVSCDVQLRDCSLRSGHRPRKNAQLVHLSTPSDTRVAWTVFHGQYLPYRTGLYRIWEIRSEYASQTHFAEEAFSRSRQSTLHCTVSFPNKKQLCLRSNSNNNSTSTDTHVDWKMFECCGQGHIHDDPQVIFYQPCFAAHLGYV